MRRKAHYYFGGGMEEQLSLLIQLQEVDTKIRALTERQNRMPDILASLERRRAAGQEEFEKAKGALQAAQKNKRDRDADLEASAQKVERLKARASEIKTNKEYQALQKEIEAAEQESKTIEDEILVLMEKIDAAAAAITGAEENARKEDEEIAAELKEREADHAKGEQELQEMQRQRQETAEHIERALLAKYQGLLLTKAGAAIAEARGEACSGCYMSIPPQVFVNVKKNESIITCPHCSRILYYRG
jgi:predicted  nucleic acid-binding Zn-ribbon protein